MHLPSFLHKAHLSPFGSARRPEENKKTMHTLRHPTHLRSFRNQTDSITCSPCPPSFLFPRPPNITGIEVFNQPSPSLASPYAIPKEWYASAIKELHALDQNMPLYVGDRWRMFFVSEDR